MATADVIVVGGGVSGLGLAWKAAQAGRKVVVLEREARVGGCLHSARRPDGYWFEMGAHTAYNSYGALLDIAVGTGMAGKVKERGPARGHFGLLRNGEYRWLTPPRILLQLNWLEAAVHFPLNFLRKKDGETVGSYYSKLLGHRNYERLFSPFFAAVPSQKADGFPVEGAGSLFKKRPRRPEFVRSFGFEGGLQSVCDAAAAAPGVAVEKGVRVTKVARAGAGFVVTAADGRSFDAPIAAVAATVDQAPSLLRDDFPALASAIARVRTVAVESVGVVLPREKCWMPECAFLVPIDDVFHSCVTRDPFPDPRFRGFAFHFKPGLSRDERLARVSQVLRVPAAELADVVEQRVVLPSPVLGHAELVAEIDRALAGQKLAVTGNYFAGLAIEDCVLRSNAEWARLGG
ncbi:protoporphyrinogen/coproporphyrinogen oxidase [Anaeromyxobacter terrae]|uniref:protoporphyrinogen/coproporphyrinogen oxidase n=1 Tax=Anaeromyxobacter terrae TaxID=2925406 RepID=UPI001F5A9A7B|nr:FAD-dependent oxidoreductase [Anaeromyxobacter sp. SG22]